MASIFSVQNLHTFLRRKNLRPPSRGPLDPPAGRKGRRSPPPPPEPPVLAGASPDDVGLVSSAMMLLRKSDLGSWLLVLGLSRPLPCSSQRSGRWYEPRANSRLYYAVTAGTSPAGSAATGAGAGVAETLRRESLIALILSRRFCSSSILTLRNLITGSVTRRRRSSSCTSPPLPSNVSRMKRPSWNRRTTYASRRLPIFSVLLTAPPEEVTAVSSVEISLSWSSSVMSGRTINISS